MSELIAKAEHISYSITHVLTVVTHINVKGMKNSIGYSVSV